MSKKFTADELEITLAIIMYLEGLSIYYSPEVVVEIYPQNPKYKNLFYWNEEDNLITTDKELLKEFFQEIHITQINREFELLSEEGFCDKGVDNTGKIKYFPKKDLTEENLLLLLFKRLDAKK